MMQQLPEDLDDPADVFYGDYKSGNKIEDRPYVYPVRIYYEDTDAGGVVYYANYLKYFERARTDVLRMLHISQRGLKQSRNILFVVRSVNVRYDSPAYLDDEIDIVTDIVEYHGSVIKFKQKAVRELTGLAEAEVLIVCIDGETMRPKRIPQDIMAKLDLIAGD